MPLGTLNTDLRQFFSYAALSRLDRLAEADVRFTFDPEPLYLSCYREAMDLLAKSDLEKPDPDLLRYAQVFERFGPLRSAGVNPKTSFRLAAALYWLAGYSANATVLARTILQSDNPRRDLRNALVGLLARDPRVLFDPNLLRDGFEPKDAYDDFFRALASYLIRGDEAQLQRCRATCTQLSEHAYRVADAGEFVAGSLLGFVLKKLEIVSLWGSLRDSTSAPIQAWQLYAALQVRLAAPLVDLWPSQRRAIRQGLLDGQSTLVLRMPTSAGKTKMTELAFVNDLFTDDRRCLYLAPFRALVSEIEASLGPTFSFLRIPVASLYGGAEANELEVELAELARVVIGTPEKMGAVLRMAGGKLTDFGTIVLDEGHLLGSRSRGAAYELQLSMLRSEMVARSDSGLQSSRVIFLSAVLPNSRAIARWLGGSEDALAASGWHPTTLRVGILNWPANRAASLTYVRQPGQPEELEFFVPRVLEEDRWSEVNPDTGRRRSFVFPKKSDKASVALALAFKYAGQGPVIIYTQQPRWADSMAGRVLDRMSHDRPIETNLVNTQNRQALDELADYVERRLGRSAILPQALRAGIGIHHGGIPITIRLAVEDAFRTQTIRVMVATNTISQGVNFPVKTVILHSLPAGDAPVREFWNLAGRAGRALKETEGEVVLLQTNAANARAIRYYLNREHLEPAESQILQFVRAVLSLYPRVDLTTVQATLDRGETEDQPNWDGVVNAIDTQLLELMVEDLTDVESGVVEGLVDNLLATAQASDTGGNTAEESGIRDLFEARPRYLRELIPEVEDRRRFGRTGVSAGGAQALSTQLEEVRAALITVPEFGEESFEALVRAACVAPELKGENADRAAALSYVWVSTGSYERVREQGQFLSTDEAVQYVERVLSYLVPWVLNGLLRLLEPDERLPPIERALRLGEIPEWARYTPQFLRFGVAEIDLVWIMSLGIPDPAFAGWLRDQFEESTGRRPRAFREFLNWALVNQQTLQESATGWPRYFRRILSEVLDRYRELSRVLDQGTQ